MKDKIKLHNRFGDNTYLEKISDTEYILRHNSQYVEIGSQDKDDDLNLTFVDISGGPRLTVGKTVENRIIKSIKSPNYTDYIIEFEDDLLSNSK